MVKKRFDDSETAVVRRLYGQVERFVDSLPYSSDFDQMYTLFCRESRREWSENEFFEAMTSLRKKKGGLNKPR